MTALMLLLSTALAEPVSVTPTASVGVAFASTGTRSGPPSLPIWLGASIQPAPDQLSPFLALGTEVNVLFYSRVTAVEYVPSVRFGLNVLDAPEDFLGRMFPIVEFYGLVGWRLPLGVDGATRMGIGVSSPWLLAAQAELVSYDLAFLPTMIECYADLFPDGSHRIVVRAGYHF